MRRHSLDVEVLGAAPVLINAAALGSSSVVRSFHGTVQWLLLR